METRPKATTRKERRAIERAEKKKKNKVTTPQG
jgi:hypothetical protein